MFVLIVASLVTALEPASSSVKVELLPIDLKAWAEASQIELRVMEQNKAIVYSGVPLAIVLKDRAKGEGMAALRALSDAVILVRATDGYQTAISAAAVAMDPEGQRYLLALKRDGKPLGDGQGPLRLIVPGDPRHVRWVRMVSSLRLVRLDTLK
jgi:DMSO/TMAO reductase YedYZ molybdopterin-dependent catalytic subunit